MPSNGLSTDLAPIQVSTMTIATRAQNLIFFEGLNLVGLFFVFTRIARIRIDIARAITPPSFDGIERRIT